MIVSIHPAGEVPAAVQAAPAGAPVQPPAGAPASDRCGRRIRGRWDVWYCNKPKYRDTASCWSHLTPEERSEADAREAQAQRLADAATELVLALETMLEAVTQHIGSVVLPGVDLQASGSLRELRDAYEQANAALQKAGRLP